MEGKTKMVIKTKPKEFIKFHNMLMKSAPEGYIPWYFPVVANNKNPDGIDIYKRAPKGVKNPGGWKQPWARLTIEEAYDRLKNGKNIGIAGRADDDLIIIDIDEPNYINYAPDTLISISRKRCGVHAFCFKNKKDKFLPINIPTDKYGEVRSVDQYVVAPGSFVETSKSDIEQQNISDKEKLKIKNDPLLGVYSMKQLIPPKIIEFKDLPYFFQEQYLENNMKQEELEERIAVQEVNEHKELLLPKNCSSLFKINISDILKNYKRSSRIPHPLHSSDTGMNFNINENGILANCWRHNVTLNAIQFLCVKSGYATCQDAGVGHKNSNAGASIIKGDSGAIFHAWLQAKKDGYIPIDDPVPLSALKYIAIKNKLVQKDFIGKLPPKVYNKALKIIEVEY